LDVYAGALSELKRDFALVHTIGGHDEISLTDEALLLTGSFRTTLKKEDFGLESYINEEDLACRDTAEENAALVREILGGKGTLSQNYVVAANAATAASLYFQNESYLNLFQKALEVLRKKSGIEHLELSCQQS
jgi:anthranilate phosphoribosyltransferase